VLPVDGIMFHRGPIHSVFAVPILAFVLTGLLCLLDKVWKNPKALPLRPGALFLVSLVAVATHPFLDWLTTYAIALFSPVSWHWYSGDAIFIVDWVYWLLMIAGICWSVWRWRRRLPDRGRPAQIAGVLMLGYIAINLAESAIIERITASALHRQGIETTLVVAGPPPLAFWERTIEWRSADSWGSGTYSPGSGLQLDPGSAPLNLDNPKLITAKQRMRHVRSFLVWSRMPIVVEEGGRTFLTDQRFYGSLRSKVVPINLRSFFRKHSFAIPLD